MIKKHFIVIAALLCSFTLSANEMEDAYKQVREQYEQRDKGAAKALQDYLARYPYTTYADEVKMMLGVVQVEQKKYKQALKNFEEVKLTRLGRDQQPEYTFYRAYAYLMMGEQQKCLTLFNSIKQKDTPYTLAAQYYHAFALYQLGQYDKALPEFLAIEHTQQYSDIVPYYIVQIYYSQGNLDEVEQRAAHIMEVNPDNPNNGEIERIMGELQYQRGSYARAIPHLEAYEKSFREQKKELVRNDVYLLGMSYFHTEPESCQAAERYDIRVGGAASGTLVYQTAQYRTSQIALRRGGTLRLHAQSDGRSVVQLCLVYLSELIGLGRERDGFHRVPQALSEIGTYHNDPLVALRCVPALEELSGGLRGYEGD